MLKDAYTTQELIDIFEISQQAIDKRAKREYWESLPRQGRGGGHEWLVETMPRETRLAIRIAEERRILKDNEYFPPAGPISPFDQTQDRFESDLGKERRFKALAKADLVNLYLKWQREQGATIAQKEAFIDAYQAGAWPKLLNRFGKKVSWKSLERWKLQLQKTNNFLTLADKRGIYRIGHSYIDERYRGIILGQILNPNKPNISQCVRQIQKRCLAEGLKEPSDAVIRRFVKKYTQECYDEWVMWREGKKAWNDKCAISLLRDWSLAEVGDIVIADGHVLNFETINPETGKPKRMTLLLFYDGASDYPLGWEVMPTENIACISSAFRRACLTLGKFPKVVYLDNGKAFRAKFFQGTANFEEAGFLGLYRELGCEVIHAWVRNPKSKPIERFFGTFQELEVFVPSYTGNSIANKPPRMHQGETLHRKLYEKMGGRPLTLEETHAVIANWFCDYVNRSQKGGKIPAEIFQAGVGPGIDARRLALLMLQKEIRTISKDGIRHMGRLYWHEALSSRRHPVIVRYDAQAPHTVLVYTQEDEFICEARDREYYKIACGLHPAAKVLGSAEQLEDLSKAIELKKGQEKLAGANLRKMLTEVVLPETEKRQEELLKKIKEKNIAVKPKSKVMTPEEIAAVEEAKERARREMAEAEKIKYTPSSEMRFKDDIARYEYLFFTKFEKNIELTAQDQEFMETFEETPRFKRIFKCRYDEFLELFAFRKAQAL